MSLQKKLVIVGDGDCGKTYLLITFTTDIFPSTYIPTVLEYYATDVEVDGSTIELSLWDTSGIPEFDRLRPMLYPKTDVILICFSVVDTDSFNNVTEKWWPEVKKFCPNVPIVLVGTKSDLREDPYAIKEMGSLTKRAFEDLAKAIGAVAFIECSSLTKFNVNEVFTTAARAALRKPKEKKDRLCVLM